MTSSKVKLEGTVYHVDKAKFEEMVTTLISLPYQKVASVLEGVVVLNPQTPNLAGAPDKKDGNDQAPKA